MEQDNNELKDSLKKCKNYTCTGILSLITVGLIMGIYYTSIYFRM